MGRWDRRLHLPRGTAASALRELHVISWERLDLRSALGSGGLGRWTCRVRLTLTVRVSWGGGPLPRRRFSPGLRAAPGPRGAFPGRPLGGRGPNSFQPMRGGTATRHFRAKPRRKPRPSHLRWRDAEAARPSWVWRGHRPEGGCQQPGPATPVDFVSDMHARGISRATPRFPPVQGWL